MNNQITNLEVPAFFGDLSSLDLKTEYRSIKEDPIRELFWPCLMNSKLYRRAVGFFRSTVYNVIGTAIVEFVRRGGQVRIICSPELSEEDIDSIALGYARKSNIVKDILVQQIDELMSSEKTAYNTRVLATLIAIGSLDIKVAIRSDKKGLYHEKLGIFADGLGNTISFKGSANETWSGWHMQGNFESLEVFCSWRGGLEAERVKKHTAHFDTLWSEQDLDIEVFSFPIAALDHLKKAAFKNMDAIYSKEIPSHNKRRTPLPHQNAAVAGWLSHGGRGIFEHATGSGKTYTALMVIRQHIESGKPVLIVVPSKLLLDQWAIEVKKELPEAALLIAGGANSAWRLPHRLKGMTGPESSFGGRVVLATMQTASMDKFLETVIDGEHLLIVADEVHQIGSPKNSKILNINAGKRLGLSATPIRYGDPEGTQHIFEYFGGIIPPSITLNDAIRAERLVPYEYFPHTLNLSAEEAEEWLGYTERIRLEIARQKPNDSDPKPLTEKAKMLLIQRSRIAKKASAKVRLSCSVIKKNFVEGQSWLVYCEDSEQLKKVLDELRKENLKPIAYHSKMEGDHAATMSWFRSFGGILVSIRCLDEGVDIPDISHALILASSQNPRQFIQRRGRVLRRSRDKQIAVIHDAIVVPISADEEPEQISLLKSELVRAIEFSQHAINKGASAELRHIAINMGIDPETLYESGIEEEEGGYNEE